VLSIFTFMETPFGDGQGLLVNWNSSVENALELEPVQPQEYQPGSGGSQSTSVAFLSSGDEVKIAAPEARESPSLSAVASDAFSSERMADHVGLLRGIGQGGNGTGDGDDDGFFGKPGSASSYVFVLDRSRSMNTRHLYSGNITRFQRLKLELTGFIERLKPHQKFYVIFFDEQPHPMPANGLVEATEENKKDFLKWLSHVTADGRTDPRAAVRMATLLRPDQIYFLSDGEIEETFRYQLIQLPVGEWKLNTYAFGEGSERFMRVFAEKHRGKYIYIP
jgi:hypothetical protein